MATNELLLILKPWMIGLGDLTGCLNNGIVVSHGTRKAPAVTEKGRKCDQKLQFFCSKLVEDLSKNVVGERVGAWSE